MEEQLLRLELAGISLSEDQKATYLESSDDLGEAAKGADVPPGYKRCGRCGRVKKLYLFNKNSSSKTNTTGNCKECQKATAAKSYEKTKKKRNYKKYYQENKERKQAHARKYYQANKERIKIKHQEYLKTKKGQKVMQRAHAKRRQALAMNKGVPYTRELVIERDSVFLGYEHPICYLCENFIEDVSGKGLHIDHVIPVVEGGLDCFTNVACTHVSCNLTREKDARELKAAQVEAVYSRASSFIEQNPQYFE